MSHAFSAVFAASSRRLRGETLTAGIVDDMERAAVIVCAVGAFAFAFACGGTGKSAPETARGATSAADAGTSAADAAAPEPVDPWPSTRPGAAWTVVEWNMTEADARDALTRAGFDPQVRTDAATGRVEAVDVVSALNGWKAQITFDADTKKVATVTVRGDPATIAQAHAERANLEARFGPPVETHVHWSKQCANDRAIEIEGPLPAWRVTQSLTREGDAKTAVNWPSLEALTWGMPFAAVGPAMKSAGFVPEKLPPPPKKPTPDKKKSAPPKKGRPPPPAKGGKLVEVGFKKNDQHVRLGILEKAGLQQVAVGRDVADRKSAERHANDALGSLGSCLSEAETEASTFRDATADVRLSITGFQGQRVVFESYRNPAADLTKLQ